MSEEELKLLITLDDPGDMAVDVFNHLHARNNFDYWLGQRAPTWCRLDQTEAVSDTDAYRVAFGQGDWTCTVSGLTGPANESMKGVNIEVCTVTHWNDEEIIDQKVFYNLVGMQKEIGVM